MISTKILNNLEYNKILALVADFSAISITRDKIMEELPENSFQNAEKSLDLTYQAERILYHYMRSPMANFDDIEDVLARAEKMSILSYGDMLRIMRVLRASRIFKSAVSSISDDLILDMIEFSNELYEDQKFENTIGDTFISEEDISDDASPTLSNIRRKIRRLNGEIKDRLNSIVHSKQANKALQDNIVTKREGRYVVPVKVEYKGQIKGLIHDSSQSGATIYVEPIEVVELNNELRILFSDERAEIEKIMEDFTRKVSLLSSSLLKNQLLLVKLDIIFSKAKFSKSLKADRPELNNNGFINIIGGKHPLLNAEKIVPVSVTIDQKYNFILISGPNTGGKTVTLKMTGLFSLMAMSGIYVPAKSGTTLSYFSNIFSDIGDEQSIEQNLSTFSSHIKTLKYITENVNENSLVLLDEVGAGTDPQEGAALGIAILEYLLEKKCKGIITTHYSELKEFSFTTDKIINASMEFDMNTLAPTYKLILGAPGSSKALEISERLGLLKEIITNAKSKISPLKLSFEKVLGEAEQERVEASILKQENIKIKAELEKDLKQLKIEQEKINNEKIKITHLASIEAKRILNNASQEAEELLSSIKEIYNKTDYSGADVIEASKIKNKILNLSTKEDSAPPEMGLYGFDTKKASLGEKVYVLSLKSICTILKINEKKKEILVQFGNMQFTAKPSNLKCVSKDYLKYIEAQDKPIEKKKKYVKQQSSSSVQIKDNIDLELNIVGLRFFEAQVELNQFLDRAYLSGAGIVKVIHGIGTGILKKMVYDELKKNKFVRTFRQGVYGEGEVGVTIVEFKKWYI